MDGFAVILQRGGQRIFAIPGAEFGVEFRQPVSGVTIPSWQAGGATGCLQALIPKGAASLAASYLNQVSPGTLDAYTGVAPSFAAATGWTFNGSTQYLLTGITPAQGYTALVRIASVGNNGYAFGTRTGTSGRFSIQPYNALHVVQYESGDFLSASPEQTTDAILIVSGQKGYRYVGGSLTTETGTIGAWTGPASYEITLGARNVSGTPGGFGALAVLAYLIYPNTSNILNNTTIIGAVAAAMAAL